MDRPRRKATLEIQHVGDEVLVNDPELGKVHVLNLSAGRVLELCDGARTVGDIARELADETGVDADAIEPDIGAILATFAGLHLYER